MNLKPYLALAFALGVMISEPLSANGGTKNDGIAKAGDDIAIALPIIAGGLSASKDDWTGVAEMAVDTGATVGTSYLLKYVVHEERPDHSNDQSFPSNTAALGFAPAQFLWDRYGWEYGLPAYLAAGFVGYSRVESKQHHVWDVAASAAISFGYSKIFTTTYQGRNIYTYMSATPKGAYLTASYRW